MLQIGPLVLSFGQDEEYLVSEKTYAKIPPYVILGTPVFNFYASIYMHVIKRLTMSTPLFIRVVDIN